MLEIGARQGGAHNSGANIQRDVWPLLPCSAQI